VDTYGASEFRPLSRATAAHSTATLNDSSCARISHSLRLGEFSGTPLVGGPRHVSCQRIDDAGRQGFVARHDGYAQRFGIVHERELILSGNGDVLTGRDRFLNSAGGALRDNDRDLVTVRFHLHPDIALFRDDHGRFVLTAPGAERWSFTCAEVMPDVEESIYFAGLGGPRRSRQIVLAFRASEVPEVRWLFMRSGLSNYYQGR
jgi:uncharacterized heparinase superfamily protein